MRPILIAMALLLAGTLLFGQSVEQHPEWPGKGQLFVGTCYQPVDRSPEQIRQDIALMQQAGFTMVRMGDLAWDAFEPSEGQFEFAWFDQILQQMNQKGIKVILDIGGSPAPIWLHHKYPSVNLVNEQGAIVHPAERYMVDISDPVYREKLVRFAEELTQHYAHHPALAAVGYNNEIGDGFLSYSEGDRQRFIVWLKAKYRTVENLNKAWAAQRWSRRLNSFDEVDLPYANGPTPPERYLDLRRFWSDAAIAVLEDLEKVRQRNVPNLPAVSNLWDTGRRGFDYLSSYKKYVSYGAEGFYPANPLHVSLGALLVKGDLPNPLWFNEFVTGGGGNYGGPKGSIRMWAYLAIIDYGQTFLAWTFNTHRGGEEQALFGLLDHDGTPSWKYAEFGQIATEFSKLQHYGFPRYHKPDVAIAYSFDSFMASHPPGPSNTVRNYFPVSYTDQVESALKPFFEDNIDVAFLNVGHSTLDYKLLVVPADYVMDQASAAAIRNYVRNGGTVIMTALSAKVDENNQWFDTPLPGRLNDVFGIRTSEFYKPGTPPEFSLNGKTEQTTIGFYEVLEPKTASTMATLTNTAEKSPAITVNNYGKGRAIYVAVPAQMAVLAPLVRSLYSTLDIEKGPETPSGVYARVVDGRTLYVNTTGEHKTVPIRGSKRGIISGTSYEGVIRLKPYDADLVE
ncbi:MAG TPA: beta-galactosidase [Candidatus Acidoferrum sp.]|nr:beta-galactosidase [Candidatus Acidoferrum sp.]